MWVAYNIYDIGDGSSAIPGVAVTAFVSLSEHKCLKLDNRFLRHFPIKYPKPFNHVH
jgi:hypothetical protein